jgi:hypothetical protein
MSPGYSSPWGDLAVLALMYKIHVPGRLKPHPLNPRLPSSLSSEE